MPNQSGQVAFITGGSSGIGFGLAQALLECGSKVALIGSDAGRLDAAIARLDVPAERAVGIPLDVTDRENWPAAVAKAEALLGPIDLLILNAGAQGGRRPIEDIAWDEWRWVWDVNVNGVYHGLAACLPAMKRRGTAGHVLITASIGGFMQRPAATAYGAAKAAAIALAEGVRQELAGSPIGISVLCPAGVRTGIADTMRRHSPVADDTTFAFMQPVLVAGLDPLAVARYTLDAMAQGRFYIFTHPEFAAPLEAKLDEIRDALRGQADAAATIAQLSALP